jgi:hypothetical protein
VEAARRVILTAFVKSGASQDALIPNDVFVSPNSGYDDPDFAP